MSDELRDLPAIAAYGERLVQAARAQPARRRRLSALPASVMTLAVVGGVSAVGMATLLKASVIDSVQIAPREQTPVEGSARVLELRAEDPGGDLPWMLRLSRSATGLTCTTVGQVDAEAFGIVGTDGVFRELPESVVDACGTPDSLVGARAIADDDGVHERSIVYGVVAGAERAVALVRGQERELELGPEGSFVTAIEGAPTDVGLNVRVTVAGGRERDFPLGVSPVVIQDEVGGPAFLVERYGYDLPVSRRLPPTDVLRCSLLYAITPNRGGITGDQATLKTPTACFVRSSGRRWVADANVLRPGDIGAPGFDRWTWGEHPARTVVWGLGREKGSVQSVRLLGAGRPRELTVSRDSVFGAVLAASVDPRRLRLVVRFKDGSVQRGRPGVGLTPDTVPSRRYR